MCSGALVQADRRGRCHIQALGAAGHRDPHPVVGHAPRTPWAGHAILVRTATPSAPTQLGIVEAELAVDGGGQHLQTRVVQCGNGRAASDSATTGIAKMLPAEARRHLPLYGSTLCPPSTTASAPIASAMRISVPALPGSEISTATATSRLSRPARQPGRRAALRKRRPARPVSRCRTALLRHARSPDGPGTSRQHRRRSALRCDSVTKTSSTSPRRNAASTRLGPSARKRPARRRPTWRCSLTAAATRAERSVSAGTQG